MPAIDSCEQSVVNALLKEGWEVVSRPYTIAWSPEFNTVFADMRLHRSSGEVVEEIVVVEVKCFADEKHQFQDLYVAFGQYLFYRNALAVIGKVEPIYLAIPKTVYNSFFQQPAIQGMIHDARMKLLVVDIEQEVIALWIS